MTLCVHYLYSSAFDAIISEGLFVQKLIAIVRQSQYAIDFSSTVHLQD